MKFFDVNGQANTAAELAEEYRASHEVGVLRVGEQNLFFRAGLRNYFIPYTGISRIFRRVMMVPAKMCCGKGNFRVESLVVSNEERELAEIQLPGEKAAKLLMEELKEKLPNVNFTAPPKEEKEALS